MRFNWKRIAKRAKGPAAGAAAAALLFGAYWLGGLPPAETATETSAPVQNETRDEARGDAKEEPVPLAVPRSAAQARSSGVGGQTWMSGDTGALGSEFKRSIGSRFGNGTLGQADRAMTGMGFSCSLKSGRMSCTKSLQADNCTLTWSVQMEAEGGSVGSAGGDGFSRSCS